MRTAPSPLLVRPVGARRAAPRFAWFIPMASWQRILFVSALALVFGALARPQQSLWVWVSAAVALVVVWHSAIASRRVPWLPGIIGTIAAVQWVLAALVVYYSGLASSLIGDMKVPAGEYFAFAGPSLFALVAGMWLPLRAEGTRPVPGAPRVAMTPALQTVSEVMVWGGLAVRFITAFAPVNLRYAALLVADLAYVGAFALTIGRVPGWSWRVLAVLSVEFLFSARASMFLLTVLWTTCAAVIIVYRFRPRMVWIVGAVTAALLVVTALNTYKQLYRDEVLAAAGDANDRAEQASAHVTSLLAHPSDLLSRENLVRSVNRVNQGSLTSHVLIWVPAAEPFAGGETIVNGLRAALVPRVLDPNKYVAGGSEYFERFTGIALIKGTSMNLSIPGEMYANFGYSGGIAGVFVYGLCLGLVFRFVLRRARRSPFWWAWAPYLLLSSLSAEDGFGETVNQVAKSLLVMLVISQVIPAWRALKPRRAVANRQWRALTPALAQGGAVSPEVVSDAV